MNRLFWKKLFDESNLLVIIPAIFVVASLVGFLIYGLSSPSTSGIDVSTSLLETQQASENEFLVEFSNGDYTKEDPYFVLDPYDIAPLSGLLMFDTLESAEFKILVKGKTEEGNIEYLTDSAISHIIPVYGLYPKTKNRIEIYELVGEDNYTLINTVFVDTTSLPNSIILPEYVRTSHDYFGDDLMITMSKNSNLAVGYDYLGDVRWYLSKEMSWTPKLLDNGHFLFGYRDLVSPYYSSELIEIDYLGKIYTRYNIPGGYHHDYFELPNGNLLVATNDFDGTLEDIIIELDRSTGEIVKTMDVTDYLNRLDGQSELWTLIDWFHLNSIFYDAITDSIILSGKNQDIVISVGYTSDKLNWVIGDPENWDVDFTNEYFFTPIGEDFEWQYAQSSAVALDNGDIFMFDNGINKSKLRESDVLVTDTYSRGVIYSIDTELMTIEQVYEYGKELGVTFYSPENTNIDYYDVDNYLIHSGGQVFINGDIEAFPNPDILEEDTIRYSSSTIEINNGETAYKMIIADNIYQTNRISLYDQFANFILSESVTLGEQTVTEEYTKRIRTKFNLFENIPVDYDIVFEKEFDRLMIKGTFNQEELVYIVLENKNETKQYIIPTVENSFSALCLDVCHDGTLDITYFINEKDVSGKFEIFFIIDGKKYNTYKTVIFE